MVRRGAREAAVEIRLIDVPKQPRRGAGGGAGTRPIDAVRSKPSVAIADGTQRSEGTSSQDSNDVGTLDRRALTAAVLADPVAVATVIRALAGLHEMGKFSGAKWASVRAGVVSLADLVRTDDGGVRSAALGDAHPRSGRSARSGL
ncbi:hypothetical protein GCM10027572_16910 [Flexivirga lutea]